MLASGVGKLAQVLSKRIGQQTQRPDVLELGVIKSDMSLLLDRFPIPIPRGDYMVCRTRTVPNPMCTTSTGGAHPHGPSGGHEQGTGTGIHSHPASEGAHKHNIPRPSQLSPLKPGDRVLVAWVNDGIDPVVIDVVASS